MLTQTNHKVNLLNQQKLDSARNVKELVDIKLEKVSHHRNSQLEQVNFNGRNTQAFTPNLTSTQ